MVTGDRLEGYKNALSRGSIAVREDFVVYAEKSTIKAGFAATERLLPLFDRPQAIFAMYDTLAISALRSAQPRLVSIWARQRSHQGAYFRLRSSMTSDAREAESSEEAIAILPEKVSVECAREAGTVHAGTNSAAASGCRRSKGDRAQGSPAAGGFSYISS